MKLKLRIITLQGLHLDDCGLFKVGQSKLFTFDLCDGLHNLGQGIDDIDQIIALIENSVNELASLSEFGLQTCSQNIQHKIRMRLITNLENIIFINESKASCCSLQIVKGVSHVSISSENESFQSIIRILNPFLIHNNFESFQDFIIVELSEADNGAT